MSVGSTFFGSQPTVSVGLRVLGPACVVGVTAGGDRGLRWRGLHRGGRDRRGPFMPARVSPSRRGALMLEPFIEQPNGPGCDPTVHQATVELPALRALD